MSTVFGCDGRHTRSGHSQSAPAAKNPKPGFSWGRMLAWVLIGILILVTLFPFYWMLRTAFSTGTALGSDSSSLLPADFTLGAFKRVLGLSTIEEAQAQGGSGASVHFWSSLRNSIIIVAAHHRRAGRFLARWPPTPSPGSSWPGRDKVFALFLAALMVPPIFTALPNFLLIKDLGSAEHRARQSAAPRSSS